MQIWKVWTESCCHFIALLVQNAIGAMGEWCIIVHQCISYGWKGGGSNQQVIWRRFSSVSCYCVNLNLSDRFRSLDCPDRPALESAFKYSAKHGSKTMYWGRLRCLVGRHTIFHHTQCQVVFNLCNKQPSVSPTVSPATMQHVMLTKMDSTDDPETRNLPGALWVYNSYVGRGSMTPFFGKEDQLAAMDTAGVFH